MELLYFWSCISVSKHQEGDIFKTYPINKLCMSFSGIATYNYTFTFLIKAYKLKKRVLAVKPTLR